MAPDRIRTCEMHTGGEPVRIIESGYPPVPGKTILDKRDNAKQHLDSLRRLLMLEPRGHDDMYGVIQVEPDIEADMGVLFIHNEGYSTMCGHAVIALAKYAVSKGLVAVTEPETQVNIQCPCGLVRTWVEVVGGRPGRTRFHSVGAFAAALDQVLPLPDYGSIEFDVAYGGAFYCLVEAAQFGLDVRSSPVSELVSAATALTDAASSLTDIEHPTEPNLSYLYGTILTDGGLGRTGAASANICVFADAQVDRSATGSGVTARLALQRARGQVDIGETRHFESVVGSAMAAKVIADTTVATMAAVTVEVSGEAHFTGTSEFVLEDSDPFPEGFRLR